MNKQITRILSTFGSIGIVASLYASRMDFFIVSAICLGAALYRKADLEDVLSTLSAGFVCLGIAKQAWWPAILGLVIFVVFMRLPVKDAKSPRS